MLPDLALAYVRASTDRQDFGLEAQTAACQRAAEFQQLGPVEIFAEADVSGSKPFLERPEALRLIGVAQHATAQGHAVTVIVPKVDRLARDTVDVSTTARLFEQMGVRLLLLDINVDTRSPMGRAFMQIAAVFAELELARIRERIQVVMAQKRAAGIRTGTVPFGWNIEPTGETSAKGVTQFRLVDNAEEQKWILRMIEWRSAGWGYHSIAKQLNAERVPTKNGRVKMRVCTGGRDSDGKKNVAEKLTSGQWNCGMVRNILHNATVNAWLGRAERQLNR